MALDFTKAPTTNPFSLVAPGYYRFVISEAVMRPNKTDATKPPYLNLTLQLTNARGAKAGNVFEIITESSAPAPMFKLGRLVAAVGLDLTTNASLELKSLGKMLQGRAGVCEIEHSVDKKNPDAQPRAQVKLFGSDCYWPLSEFDRLVAGAATDDTTAPASEAPMPWDDMIPAADPITPSPTAPVAADNSGY